MSYEQVEVGDFVSVIFADGDLIKGTVRYIPNGTGDSWVIETEDTIIHVQMFETITKRKAAP